MFECPHENRQLYVSLLVEYVDSVLGQTTKRMLLSLNEERFARSIPDEVAAKFAKAGIEIRSDAAAMVVDPLYSY